MIDPRHPKPHQLDDGAFGGVMAMTDGKFATGSTHQNSNGSDQGNLSAKEVQALMVMLIKTNFMIWWLLTAYFPFVTFKFLDNLHIAPAQNKEHFKKFMDSVLRNSTKLKSLLRDIKSNYVEESGRQP